MTVTNLIFGILAVWLVAWQVRPIFGVRRITAAALRARLRQNPSLRVVDVRTEDEWAQGHIEGSLSIPLGRLRAEVHRLSPEDDVVLVCRTGYRAMQAFHILRRRKFQRLWVLQGGMVAWMQEIAAGPAPSMD